MSTDTAPTGYTPVTPMSTLESQYSWLFDASVEDVPYQLIILGFMLLLMAYCNLQMNDVSQVSGATSKMSQDVTTIDNELTTAQGGFTIDSDGNVEMNGTFTQQDASDLENAFVDLYVTDSSSSYTWSQMNITWDGSTYYLWPNGEWSTTEWTDQAFTISGKNGESITVNQNGVLNSSMGVSDAGLYMMSTAVYQVDMASYTGGELDTTEVFSTTSEYQSTTDPVMEGLDGLWDAFNTTSYNGSTTAWFILADASSDFDGSNLYGAFANDGGMIDEYANSLENGGGSTLSNMTQQANNALTQINNMSTLLTNQIQELTQELENYNSLAQTVIQDATQANMNSVNNQKA